MIDQYPYWNAGISIVRKYGAILVNNARSGSFFPINESALAILCACNGAHTVKQVVLACLQSGAKGDPGEFIEGVVRFLENLMNRGVLLLSDGPLDGPVAFVDASEICYPDNIVFELTDYCNLNCIHCYRNSNATRSSYIDADRMLAAVGELRQYGLKSIHLTGGEPTTHPDFLKILEGALRLCPSVIILSNGTNFSEEAIAVFRENRDKLKIQVDLDCSDEAIHDRIRGCKGAFAATTRFMRRAMEEGIPVEVAMSVCGLNLDYLEQTVELTKALGAASFTCSPIVELGRGKNLSGLNEEQVTQFILTLQDLNEKYEGLMKNPGVTTDDIEKRRNCGGGHRNVVCAPSGDIRPCILMPTDMLVMGNLFAEKASELFAKPIFKHFAGLQSPNAETCGVCRFNTTCLGCFSKPLVMEDQMKEADPGFACRRKESILFEA